MATTDYISAQTLPANIEAERSILGAILLDNLAYNQAAEHLKPEDFLLDSHRRIYSRMIDLSEASHSIDLITLCEELSRNSELETIGGAAYVFELFDGVPDRPSIENYIKIVRDKSLLRRSFIPLRPRLRALPSRVTRRKRYSTTLKRRSSSFQHLPERLYL